jgi:hypothetical protein
MRWIVADRERDVHAAAPGARRAALGHDGSVRRVARPIVLLLAAASCAWRTAVAGAVLLGSVLAVVSPLAAQPVHPFELDARTFEFAGGYLQEFRNKNLSTDALAGATFTAGASWAPGWQALTEFGLGRVMLGSGAHAIYGSLTGGFRRRIVGHGRPTAYIEALFGFALASRHVPDRGTSFNWVVQGGGGLMWRLTDRTHALTGVRVSHLSNAGMKGPHRNPDIDAIGGYAGVAVAF